MRDGGRSQRNEVFTLSSQVQDSTSAVRDEKAVQSCATDHVYQPIPEISSHISAARNKHPGWAKIRSLIEGASQTARYGISWDETDYVKHLTYPSGSIVDSSLLKS